MVEAQCAGANNTIDVCNKDADIANRNFDLFSRLNGAATVGGTWSTNNPANFSALDQTNGILDLWRINNFGVHQFVYTNSSCGESATVTINLGGYPGEDNIDGSANACSDSTVNLDGFLGSEVDGKVQDFNGLWQEDPSTATGDLQDNIFDAEAAGPGIYIFTYTVGAVESCPSRTATLILEVHRSPEPGEGGSLNLCTNEDFSAYTNFDLNSLLVGQDPNGTWSEVGTNQLSDLNDSFINIEEINTNFGFNSYEFTYTVYPTHPVCIEETATVSINILPVLNGALSTENYCLGETYTVSLTYDNSIMPNGMYDITYNLSSSAGSISRIVESVTLNNGAASFDLDPNDVPPNVLNTINLSDIVGITPERDICSSILVNASTFIVSNANANVSELCVLTDATVEIVNIFDNIGNSANGLFNVDYTLTNPSGIDSTVNLTDIEFTNGAATFTIAAANLSDSGTYSVAFSIANTFQTNCNLSTTFNAIPIPDEIQLQLLIDNSCDATVIDVVIDAPILGNGTYTITYDVTEAETNTVLTTNTINFTGGTANYQIDVDALPVGNYTASVLSTQNDTTPCRLVFEFEETENFARGGIPEPPEAVNQTFCSSDFSSGPTLMDIEVTATGDILFYATATDNTILPINTVLVDGEDYFISNTNPENNCEGSERVQVVVTLSDLLAPTGDTNPQFCAESLPTLAAINSIVTAGNTVVWYSAATNGTMLDSATILEDGQSYYAATYDGTCESAQRLEVTPTVTTVAQTLLTNTNLVLCGLDNPTVSELRTLENEFDNEVFWFTTETGGTALTDNIPLLENTIYYAESFNTTTACSSAQRVAVTVDLSNCEPEEYDFFIPDGFSPNADGRNDTFYIPNIETIFPDFTLEILNRYGTSIFKGDRNNPAWDGSNGSSTAPNGVYFYIINYNKDNSEPIQGRLYLNR